MPNCVNPNLAKSRLPPTGLHTQFCRCYPAEEQGLLLTFSPLCWCPSKAGVSLLLVWMRMTGKPTRVGDLTGLEESGIDGPCRFQGLMIGQGVISPKNRHSISLLSPQLTHTVFWLNKEKTIIIISLKSFDCSAFIWNGMILILIMYYYAELNLAGFSNWIFDLHQLWMRSWSSFWWWELDSINVRRYNCKGSSLLHIYL